MDKLLVVLGGPLAFLAMLVAMACIGSERRSARLIAIGVMGFPISVLLGASLQAMITQTWGPLLAFFRPIAVPLGLALVVALWALLDLVGGYFRLRRSSAGKSGPL